MLVPQPAPSAFEHDLTPVVSGHIRNDLLCPGFLDDGSFRYFQHQILAALAVAAALAALFPVSCRKLPLMSVIHQRIQALIDFKDQIAAVAAVAAVRSSICYIQFPPEAAVSIAALSRPDHDFCSVRKHTYSPITKTLIYYGIKKAGNTSCLVGTTIILPSDR